MTAKSIAKEELRKALSDIEYQVTQESATEPAFSGIYHDHKTAGLYKCVCCDSVLFDSHDKYDSGTGWPSFDRASVELAVVENTDASYGMERTEITCATCAAHLGHMFNDGPKNTTGVRYCVNSAALNFQKS